MAQCGPSKCTRDQNGPVRRGQGRSSESRGAPVPHSLGGTWGGTTTPMRLDAAAPRSLLAISLRDLCPRCTFRHNCPDDACRDAHDQHHGHRRQQADLPVRRHRCGRRDPLSRDARDRAGQCRALRFRRRRKTRRGYAARARFLLGGRRHSGVHRCAAARTAPDLCFDLGGSAWPVE